MEDAVSIVENLLEVSRSGGFWRSDRSRQDHHLKLEGVSGNGSVSPPVRRLSRESIETEVCHFFGVYDGHNGPYAAHHCRGRLHENLRAAYMDLCSSGESDTESVTVGMDMGMTATASSVDMQGWSSAANHLSNSEGLSNGATSRMASTAAMTPTEEEVFMETFRRTDHQFSEYRCAERVGTTALTALVGANHITVGSCGLIP